MIPDVPADLEKIINRCLRKVPERRWQHMADLQVALEDLKEDSDLASRALRLSTGRHVDDEFGSLVLIALLLAVPLAVWLVRSTNRTPIETPMIAVPLTSYPGEERSLFA